MYIKQSFIKTTHEQYTPTLCTVTKHIKINLCIFNVFFTPVENTIRIHSAVCLNYVKQYEGNQRYANVYRCRLITRIEISQPARDVTTRTNAIDEHLFIMTISFCYLTTQST